MSVELYRPAKGTHNQWLKEQIYTTPENAFGIERGGVVPNVNDEVITWIGNGRFSERVVDVNQDNTSVLAPTTIVDGNGSPITIGADIGTAQLLSMANLYLNDKNSKLPVSVDVRVPITGLDLQYARLFLGTDISNAGKVISVQYDESGDPIGDRLEVRRVNPSDVNDIRVDVRTGNIIQLLPQDTVVTLVIYNSNNGPVRILNLTVKYNSLVANLDNSALFVKDLELSHPWVDPQNSHRILLPKNMLLQSFSPTVKKVYQNGSRELILDNNTNLTIEGWGDYLKGTVGDMFTIVVKYVLAPGERSIIVDPVLARHIAKIYTVLIVDKGVGVNYKLFPLLDFHPDTGYTLRWMLHFSDYSNRIDVTEFVASNTLSPSSYGGQQIINYSLDLNDVTEIASNEEIAGSVTVELLADPITQPTSFRLYDTPSDEHPYGDNIIFRLRPGISHYSLDITCGYTVKEEWLDRLYYRLNPMYDPLLTSHAPLPTHVDVKVGNALFTFTVDNWDSFKNWTDALPVNGIGADVTFYILNGNNERSFLAMSRVYIEIV